MNLKSLRSMTAVFVFISVGVFYLPAFAADSSSSVQQTDSDSKKISAAGQQQSFKKPSQLSDSEGDSGEKESEGSSLQASIRAFRLKLKDIHSRMLEAGKEYRKDLSNAQNSKERKDAYTKYLSSIKQLSSEIREAVGLLNSTVNSGENYSNTGTATLGTQTSASSASTVQTGGSSTITLGSSNAKTVTLGSQTSGTSASAVHTGGSSAITLGSSNATIDSNPSSLTVPTVTSAVCAVDGTVTFTFSSALKPSDLKEFWAEVKYDSYTYYWTLGTGVLSADGKTVKMQMGSDYHGKTMSFAFFGVDTTGKKTGMTNAVSVLIDSSPSSLTVPTVTSAVCDVNGSVTFTLSSALKPSDLKAFWAQVKYDNNTYYWDLGTGALSADGKTVKMQMNTEHNGKVVSFAFLATDNSGKQTSWTQPVTVTITSSPSSVVMPTVTSAVCAVDGTVTFTLSSALKPSDLKEFWAEVKYDNYTYYWTLGTGVLSADGKTVKMQMGSDYHGKTMSFAFFGVDTTGKKTGMTNAVSVLIDSSPSSLTVPTVTSAVCDVNGIVTFSLSSALKPSDLKAFWAQVKYDNNTYYWDLGTGVLSADGKTVKVQMNSEHNGKVVSFAFLATDNSGKQTSLTQPVTVTITSSPSSVVMPTVTSAVCAVDGTVTFTLSSALKPSDLKEFWAEVKYDSFTYYWTLGTGVLSADGKTVKMQMGSDYHGKTMSFAFFGVDTTGKKTGMTNAVSVLIDSSPSSLTVPTVTSAVCDVNGIVTFSLSSALKPSDLKAFWAQVKYDNNTYYWDLGTGVLSADGKTVKVQMNSEHNGKVVSFAFLATDKSGKQTSLTQPVTVTITSSPSSVVMPTVTSAVCAVDGTVTFTLSSALKPSDLKEFWAEVKYDSFTYYWTLGTGVLSADGKTVKMQMGSDYHGKTMSFAFFGVDTTGKKTGMTNAVSVLIDSSPSSLTVPTVTSAVCDVNGIVTFSLSSALKPSDLKAFWAQVKYDNNTYYWDLGTGVLSADGKTVKVQMKSEHNGKVISFAFFAIDKSGKQTSLTQPVTVTITSSPSSVVMPTVTSAVCDVNGNVTFTLSSALKPSDLKEFWAEVTYDGSTYYWKLGTGVLSADGKTVKMQLSSDYDGKTMSFAFYGVDTTGKNTGTTNAVSVLIDSNASSLTVPTVTSAVCDVNGNVTFTLSSALKPSDLKEFWAEVTYDGKTYYWNLTPGVLSADGKTVKMQLGSDYDGKTMSFAFFGVDTTGKKTGTTNAVSVLIDSNASSLIVPTVTSAVCDVNGNVTFTLSSALKPSDLKEFWAEVTYDGKTYYWNLTPGVLSADGKTVKMQLGSDYDGKTMSFAFFGVDTTGKKTGMTNAVSVLIDSNASSLIVPTVTSAVCDVNGNVTFTLSSALKPSDLKEFWAEVTYDGKTYYWTLTPGVLSADGKTVKMQLGSDYDGKTMSFAFFGVDTTGKKTGTTNAVSVLIDSNASSLIVPTVTSAVCDVNGNVTFTLSSALKPSDLKEFWAEVTYDGKTYYWNLTPGVLSADGKTVKMQLGSDYDGKTMSFAFFGVDTTGKKTGTTNAVSVLIDSNASSLIVPTVTSAVCDVNGNVTFTLSSALKPSDLKEFWAEVTYDGKTYYWTLTPGVLSADGKTVKMQLGSDYDGKTMSFAFFGVDTTGKKTGTTNAVSVLIDSNASSLTVPTVTSAVCDVNGNVTFTLSSALKPSDLKEFWAEVTYDGKTYYWTLTPGVLSADGKTVKMQLGSDYDGKTMSFAFFGVDTTGKKTGTTNAVSVLIDSNASSLIVPTVTSAVCDVNGNVTFTLSSALKPSDLKEFWAEVTYDGKTYYWNLTPGVLSADGKTVKMQLGSDYDGKTMSFAFFGVDTTGKKTGTTNAVSVLIDSNASSLTVPTVTSAVCDVNGNVTFTLSSALKPSDLKEFWAEVTYDGKTYYWTLTPGVLSADGKTVKMQLGSDYDGKTMSFAFFGVDTTGKKTGTTNAVSVLIDSNASSLTVPTVTSAVCDVNGNVTFTLSSALKPSDLKEFWAEVTYDGKTYYWTLTPGVLSADGTTVKIQLSSDYDGKTMSFAFFGVDTTGKKTGTTNAVSVLIDSNGSSLIVPTVTSAVCDVNGNVTFTLSSALKPADLRDFWAEVKYDGAVYYWKLGTGVLSADGMTVKTQLDSAYDGKTMSFAFFGVDTTGKQTGTTNAVSVLIDSDPSPLAVPQLASYVSNPSGTVTINVSDGAFIPTTLSEFWMQITYDGVTQYWNITPGVLSADGKTITLNLDASLSGKVLYLAFFGVDTGNKKTKFTNTIAVTFTK